MCRTYKLILLALNTLALVMAIAIITCGKMTMEPYIPNTVLDSASENQRDVTKLRSIVAINNGRINLLEESAVQSGLLKEILLLFYGGVALMNLLIFGLAQRCKSRSTA